MLLYPLLFLILLPENIQFENFFYFTELIHGKKHLPREDETVQKLARIDNFNDVADKSTEEKNEMSEIESTMKDCHINMEENLFYKVIKNDDGKFLDCVALQGIKAGTIILEEKPQ